LTASKAAPVRSGAATGSSRSEQKEMNRQQPESNIPDDTGRGIPGLLRFFAAILFSQRKRHIGNTEGEHNDRWALARFFTRTQQRSRRQTYQLVRNDAVHFLERSVAETNGSIFKRCSYEFFRARFLFLGWHAFETIGVVQFALG